MGRRPNAFILQWFERGQKLNDHSNRYAHTCKACGELFPKGRLDSLTNHLTKKCPAISEADRINACLTLHIGHGSQRGQRNQQHPEQTPGMPTATDVPVDLPLMPRDWTALETLAEVSRQQLNDDRGQNGLPPGTAPPVQGAERFELQEQFTLDNPPFTYDGRQSKEKKGDSQSSPEADKDLITEEKLQALLRSAESPTDSTNISMAAAATARLNPSLLDPQLGGGEAVTPPDTAAADASDKSPITTPNSAQPWGEITYASETFQPFMRTVGALAKGGLRIETGLNGAKSRHSRAKFDATRRKEVQEVRKIGACIRCRILRKTCSKGNPCDTCRKVLSPRVWRSGCVRTKFSEELDLYSAGVQIVLAQKRMNELKASLSLGNRGTVIEACHFPETETRLLLQVLQTTTPLKEEGIATSSAQNDAFMTQSIVMIDNETQDLPNRVELYMREALPEFINREPSHFMKVTLRTGLEIAAETNDELLKKSLELWGLVEILERERQWVIRVMPKTPGQEYGYIQEDEHQEIFTTICSQLAAATERKASAISKTLLTGMQRVLQDSKVKVDFGMYFTTLILLNCVEKSTWTFRAWEQERVRAMWPLDKDPGSFTQQGYVIANLLRMLLAIRKAMPRTVRREDDGTLATEEQDPVMQGYFQKLSLNCAQVKEKQDHPVFSPTDPRSFELLFCSTLLLPGED